MTASLADDPSPTWVWRTRAAQNLNVITTGSEGGVITWMRKSLLPFESCLSFQTRKGGLSDFSGTAVRSSASPAPLRQVAAHLSHSDQSGIPQERTHTPTLPFFPALSRHLLFSYK